MRPTSVRSRPLGQKPYERTKLLSILTTFAYNIRIIRVMIIIHVKLNKKKEGVEKISDTKFVVYTKKPAIENKANEDVIKQIAKYFKISKSSVSIMRGATSKTKILKIVTSN